VNPEREAMIRRANEQELWTTHERQGIVRDIFAALDAARQQVEIVDGLRARENAHLGQQVADLKAIIGRQEEEITDLREESAVAAELLLRLEAMQAERDIEREKVRVLIHKGWLACERGIQSESDALTRTAPAAEEAYGTPQDCPLPADLGPYPAAEERVPVRFDPEQPGLAEECTGCPHMEPCHTELWRDCRRVVELP
jgi:hypothetical protein